MTTLDTVRALPAESQTLTPAEFKRALRGLGLTQTRFAAAVDVHVRTAQKWSGAESPVPRYAAIILGLMARFDLSIDDIEAA